MPVDALTWDLAAIPAIIVGGTLLHFAFDRAGRPVIIAAFCPVNESVWEHLKMAYWPALAVTLVQIVAGAGGAGLTSARAIGAVTMCAVMLGLYHLSTALAPMMSMRVRLVVDGITFVVAVIVGQLLCHLLLTPLSGVSAGTAALLMAIPGVILTATTFAPPRTRWFEDQVTGGYGVRAAGSEHGQAR